MVGDALGAPAAFNTHAEIMARFPAGLDRMVQGFGACSERLAGRVTGNTRMVWLLHQALQEAKGWNADVTRQKYREFSPTYSYQPGNTPENVPEELSNWQILGNCALVRMLPIALWAHKHPDFDWQQAAREDAELLYPYPVYGDCNVVYLYALLQAMKGGLSPREIYETTLAWAESQELSPEVLDTLRQADTEPPDIEVERLGWKRVVQRGWARVALQSAFYQLLHAADFRSALVDIVCAGGDTSANAAIAAPLLAAVHGPRSIPREWLVHMRAVNELRFTTQGIRRQDELFHLQA